MDWRHALALLCILALAIMLIGDARRGRVYRSGWHLTWIFVEGFLLGTIAAKLLIDAAVYWGR